MRWLLSLLLGSVLSTSARADPIYTGCCDASAAVAVDAEHFIVADDEDSVLRLYNREGGAPFKKVDLGPFLKKKGAPGKEVDIEAAAVLDDLIYWMGSHGLNAKGKDSPSRRQIIATRFDFSDGNVEIAPVSKPYPHLLADLLADSRFNRFNLKAAAERAPKTEGAFNIEGMTATPEGHLLVGLRNPIPDSKALVVPILNPRSLFEGERARLGDPIQLDLGGLGIRGLGYFEGKYFIIAGKPDAGGNSRLYEWKRGEAEPRWLQNVELRGLNPEGITFTKRDGTQELLLLSDDGTRSVDGQECKSLKDESKKRFRGVSVMMN